MATCRRAGHVAGEMNMAASSATTATKADAAGRKSLLGRKVGMTQVFDADGTVVPVTVIEAGPCPILSVVRPIATAMRPSRWASATSRGGSPAAVQGAGGGARWASGQGRVAEAGVAVVAKAGCEPQRFVREFRGASMTGPKWARCSRSISSTASNSWTSPAPPRVGARPYADEAAWLQGPASQPRREEGASAIRAARA